MIDIPCHPYFVNKESTTDSNVVTDSNVIKDGVKDGVKGGVKELTKIQEVIVKELSERQKIILDFISENPALTAKEMSERMSEKAGIVPRTIQRDLQNFRRKAL